MKKNKLAKNKYKTNKKDKLIFLLPVVILLTGIVICMVLYSIDNEKMLSFIYYLYADLKYIFSGGQVSNIKLPENNSTIGARLLCWLWIASFIISLFIVSKRLHRGFHFFATDAILKKREPYLMIENINRTLRKINMEINNSKLDSFISKVNTIKEKLSVESDFGVGIQEVIDCENEIARQLQVLSTTIQNIKVNNIEESINVLNILIADINSLLQQRTELKRQ